MGTVMVDLVPCPSCGRQVSPRAAACPQCGAPIGGILAARGVIRERLEDRAPERDAHGGRVAPPARGTSPGLWKGIGFGLIVVAIFYGVLGATGGPLDVGRIATATWIGIAGFVAFIVGRFKQ